MTQTQHYIAIGKRWVENYQRGLTTLSHKGNENSGRYPRGSGKRPYQHTGKKLSNGNIKIAPDVVRKAIRSGAVSKKVKISDQLKHGEATHTSGRSYMYGGLETAQALIDALSGSGDPVPARNGNWNRKERVRADRLIGVHVDQKTGKETPTAAAMIHYGKGGAHIMPRKDEDDA